MTRSRLDETLVQRGLCESRAQAQRWILAGKVRSGTEVLDKPGKRIPLDLPIELLEAPRYVGRGGEKLRGFLDAHPIPLQGIRALDIGASTGGFTDCLLQKGVAHVTCVDVGYGQLHYKLREDPRIANRERINARHLTPDLLPYPDYDLIVMDLSFISLRKVLPAVWPFLRPNGNLIALIKPQFEATRAEVGKGRGIIHDPAIHERVLKEIRDFALAELPNAQQTSCIPSPIAGGDGNQEFLQGLTKSDSSDLSD